MFKENDKIISLEDKHSLQENLEKTEHIFSYYVKLSFEVW